MNRETTMDRLLELFECKNDQEFLKELLKIGKINQSQVSRWRNNGFAASTAILLERMFIEIDHLKKEAGAKK